LIEIERIRPDPDQPRKDFASESQRELTVSVKRLGILQPITVRHIEPDNVYQIITGERRYRAATEAGLKKLPCWIQSPKEEDVLLHQIVENWQRSDLNPFELADSLAILRDVNGFTQQELADHTGKNKSEISRLLSLLQLHPDVQRIARQDTSCGITKRHLFAIARLEIDQQEQMIRRIQNENMTAISAERCVARFQKTGGKPGKKATAVCRRRYATTHANVVFTFRKSEATNEDMLLALSEIKKQIDRRITTPNSPESSRN